MSRHWGYTSLRPLQEEAIEAVLAGKDSLVVLPTGGGKSLCYEIPALLGKRLTLVVSPLISLMKDQVDGLRECGIAAGQMNSSQSPFDNRIVEHDVREGLIKLLFVSPERLAMPRFREFLRDCGVSAFAIDEAHCISHWGHDFRPEYRQLAALRAEFPEASVHAYTATATRRVRRDIVEQLALRDPAVLVGDFDRPNLVYRVFPRLDAWKQTVEVLDRHKGEAGIIYCIRRADVDELVEKARKRGYNAVGYHAGLPQEERRAAQDAFATEKCDIVVATVAFGMGIDRSNVRFILHAAMPKSVEHYQQESGRAGRDGLDAECVILYSGADAIAWRSLIERAGEDGELPDPEAVANALRHLNDMDRYCSGTMCRHRALVEYFGQTYPRPSCDACDICLGETADVEDALTIAQKILSCVYRLRESFGVGHIISVLRGEATEKLRQWRHDQLSTFGILKGHGRNEIRDWIFQLAAQGHLTQTNDQYPIMRLTETSRSVLKGEAQVRLRQPIATRQRDTTSRRKPPAAESWEGVDRRLFDALRSWRRSTAEARGVPPYVVFSDRTLRELARTQPTTLVELRDIYGIGATKLTEFGPAIIEQIRDAQGPQ